MSNATGLISLADLASMDTDDIQAIETRVHQAGVYDCRIESAKSGGGEWDEANNRQNAFTVSYIYEVLHATLIDKAVDANAKVGRKIRESFRIWPADIGEGIGLIKGRHQKAGLQNSGMPMGGDGKAVGWLDAAVGGIVSLQVRTGIIKATGQQTNFFDWLKPDSATQGTAEELPPEELGVDLSGGASTTAAEPVA